MIITALYITMRNCKYLYLIVVAFLQVDQQVIGQTLTVNAAYSPQQLVEDFLLGPNVLVSNIQFTGNEGARGYFDGANSNIGLPSGILLSTGLATDAEGPNGTPLSDQGTGFGGEGDSVLGSIIGAPFSTNDAAILEFDFQLPSDTVYLRYVFASNEYMLYAGAGTNDIFAVFLSGPGIDGEQNLALIPGTDLPVTIDNVNANTYAQYYVSNENPPGATVEYNGFTHAFTAHATIIPNETYHVRIAIVDVADDLYDSAIFLQQGSFRGSLIGLSVESDHLTTKHVVYPNPFAETTTLTYENLTQQLATLTVTTLAGQLVRTMSNTTGQLQIDREGLSAGVYFYQLRMADGRQAVGKLVVD
jgi:hypothetical protein